MEKLYKMVVNSAHVEEFEKFSNFAERLKEIDVELEVSKSDSVDTVAYYCNDELVHEGSFYNDIEFINFISEEDEEHGCGGNCGGGCSC